MSLHLDVDELSEVAQMVDEHIDDFRKDPDLEAISGGGFQLQVVRGEDNTVHSIEVLRHVLTVRP